MSMAMLAMIGELRKRIETLESEVNLLKKGQSAQDSVKSPEPVGQKPPLGLKKAS